MSEWRFLEPRVVPGVDLREPSLRARRWLEGVTLDARERAQLLWIARLFEESLTEERLCAGALEALGEAQTLAEVPLEWWSLAEGGARRYELWLCNADTGYLFEAGSTRLVGSVAQGFFWPQDPAVEALAERFAEAQARVEGSAWLLRAVRFAGAQKSQL